MFISCIGSGVMGTALMKAAAQSIGGSHIGFTDVDPVRVGAAAEEAGGMVFSDNISALEKADWAFLAVKPVALPGLLDEIHSVLLKRLRDERAILLVSPVAGWSIKKIRDTVGIDNQPLVRIMPNLPVLVREGMIACTPSPEITEVQWAELQQILSCAGSVDRIDESLLDAVTALSGSGPAFSALFIESLADGGVRAGLSREKALRYAVQTVLGSAALLKETGMHPALLKDKVCSPAGTSIAGVEALEAGGFRGTLMKAIDAAFDRTKRLATT
ncbi:pyrroline-5-carboxylate reductase [Spirochaetia bacterium]|nr:pyrroline-5-carboxylate reductase [Spirochaetia bacterium]